MKIKPTSPHWKSEYLPKRESKYASGLDLYACFGEEQAVMSGGPYTEGDPFLWINPGERALIPCGFTMQIPPGWEAQVRPRSGLALRDGVTVLNSPGTIDSDYRGEIKVILMNHGKNGAVVKPGIRIAQMVFAPVAMEVDVEVVDHLDESERGTEGFGSTGR